jgi:hypothetical protein
MPQFYTFSKISNGSFDPESTLARLEPTLDLVDHVNPALATNKTVIAVTTAQRFQRITDLHGTILMLRKAVFGAILIGVQKWQN